MNRGTGPQSLRSIPGNAFQNQMSQQRQGALGSGRLQNGKVGGGAPSWGTGMAGAPVPSNSQARGGNNSFSSIAQTIGGSRNNAPLDPSEFPSLSNAPQSQQNASSQAIWGNSNFRAPQSAIGQRPQQHPPQGVVGSNQPSASNQPPSNSQQPQQRPDPQQDSQPSPFPSLEGGIADLRLGGPDAAGRVSRASGQQGRGGDEFPPLGGLGDPDMGGRRSGLGPGGHYHGFGDGPFGAPPPPPPPNRNNAMGQGEPQVDGVSANSGARRVSPSDGNSGATPSSRSPMNALMDDQGGFGQHQHGPRSSQAFGQDMSFLQRAPTHPRNSFPAPEQMAHHPFSPPNAEQSTENLPAGGFTSELAHMSDSDRFGIAGFLAMVRGGESADQTHLAHGMDLNTLGLDLQRPDNSPLHPDWPGPFADPAARPIIPEYDLPPSYNVHNVPPLATKISSFSDETLFAIFYQNPRDQAQELAATELYSRDWRWHKKLQQWMMKAKEFGEPLQLASLKEERGFYYFFDVHNWRRERKEFILNYEHLYHGHVAGHPTGGVP